MPSSINYLEQQCWPHRITADYCVSFVNEKQQVSESCEALVWMFFKDIGRSDIHLVLLDVADLLVSHTREEKCNVGDIAEMCGGGFCTY